MNVPSLGTVSSNVTSFKDFFRKVKMTLGIGSNSAMIRRVGATKVRKKARTHILMVFLHEVKKFIHIDLLMKAQDALKGDILRREVKVPVLKKGGAEVSIKREHAQTSAGSSAELAEKMASGAPGSTISVSIA